MKCVLMNKNTEVLVAEYETNTNGFMKIYDVVNIDYAPLIVNKQYASEPAELAANLSKWFRGRGIPSWRDQLDILLARLGVQTPEELLDKSFGLSLADQYWLKPYGSDIKYDDINFFDHDFDVADFLDASFSGSSNGVKHEVSLRSPNNTTDGMLKKSWVIENGKRYLLKGGYKGDLMQPFNEVLATWIAERMNFSHVTYELSEAKGKIVSKCECFTTKDAEIIPAYQIMIGYEKHQMLEDYEEYVRLLEEGGIAGARQQLEDMVVLDYLIMNEDRHLNNFGAIRDVNTLEWTGVMPIFDNGQALNVLSYGKEGITISGEGRFFYGIEKFEDMIRVVKDFSRFDFGKLEGVVEDFRDLLSSYREVAKLTEERIDAVCKVLVGQIEKLKEKSVADYE